MQPANLIRQPTGRIVDIVSIVMPSTNPYTLALPPVGLEHQTAEPMDHPLSVIWRQKVLILCCLLLGILGGVLHWSNLGSVYISSAQLLLVAGKTSGEPWSKQLSQRDLLESRITQLKSRPLAQRLVFKSIHACRPTREIPEMVGDLLEIESKDNLLTMSFQAAAPELSHQWLTAIIWGYQRYLETTPQTNERQEGAYLEKQIQQLEEELAASRSQHLALLRPTPFVGLGRSVAEQLEQRMQKLEDKKLVLEIRQSELRQQLQSQQSHAAGSGAVRQQDELPLPRHFEQAMAAEAVSLDLKRRQVASQVRGNHAELQRVTEQAEQVWQVYDQLSKHASTEAELAELEQSIKAVQSLLTAERSYIQRWAEVTDKADRLRTKILYQEQAIANLKEQLQDSAIDQELANCSLQVIVPPGPGQPPSMLMLGCRILLPWIAGLLCCGLAAAYLIEWTDQGFRTADQLEQHLGRPLLAEIPYVTRRHARRDAMPSYVPNYQSSESKLAQQVRVLRTKMLCSGSPGPRRVLLVTSPRRGDGRSLVAANLAAALAQNGQRTLLIDANLRHPQLHKMFDVQQQPGLAELLAGSISWSVAKQASGRPHLDLIASGHTEHSPAELLSLSTWSQILLAAKQTYDYVVIDAPAALEQIDPLVIADGVDGILLLLSVGRRSRRDAEDVCELLGPLARRIVGVVMNNVDHRRSVWRPDPFAASRQSLPSQRADTWQPIAPPTDRLPARKQEPENRGAGHAPQDEDLQQIQQVLDDLSQDSQQLQPAVPSGSEAVSVPS